MKANEFIEMQRQDIETEKPAEKKILRELIAAMEAVLAYHPETEIDSKKTAAECYKQMYSVANKNKKDGYYVFTPTETMKFICGYLGVAEIPIYPAAPATTGSEKSEKPAKEAKKRRSLEDFF